MKKHFDQLKQKWEREKKFMSKFFSKKTWMNWKRQTWRRSFHIKIIIEKFFWSGKKRKKVSTHQTHSYNHRNLFQLKFLLISPKIIFSKRKKCFCLPFSLHRSNLKHHQNLFSHKRIDIVLSTTCLLLIETIFEIFCMSFLQKWLLEMARIWKCKLKRHLVTLPIPFFVCFVFGFFELRNIAKRSLKSANSIWLNQWRTIILVQMIFQRKNWMQSM